MSDAMEKIRSQQKRINHLRDRRSALEGELTQLRKQHDDAMAKLKDAHGVASLEEADVMIERLAKSIKEQSDQVDKLLAEAEALL